VRAGTNLYRHPPEVVTQALELADNGWTPVQIMRILKGRGIIVSASTIARWLRPEKAEQDRIRNRECSRRKRAEERASRPPDPYAGMTGLARKIAMLEDRVAELEERLR
jgi:IS30 family transposase